MQRSRPKFSVTLRYEINDKLEEQKANKSKLVDYLLNEFFKKNEKIPKKFLRKSKP